MYMYWRASALDALASKQHTSQNDAVASARNSQHAKIDARFWIHATIPNPNTSHAAPTSFLQPPTQPIGHHPHIPHPTSTHHTCHQTHRDNGIAFFPSERYAVAPVTAQHAACKCPENIASSTNATRQIMDCVARRKASGGKRASYSSCLSLPGDWPGHSVQFVGWPHFPLRRPLQAPAVERVTVGPLSLPSALRTEHLNSRLNSGRSPFPRVRINNLIPHLPCCTSDLMSLTLHRTNGSLKSPFDGVFRQNIPATV